jgi:hypothetical protein
MMKKEEVISTRANHSDPIIGKIKEVGLVGYTGECKAQFKLVPGVKLHVQLPYDQGYIAFDVLGNMFPENNIPTPKVVESLCQSSGTKYVLCYLAFCFSCKYPSVVVRVKNEEGTIWTSPHSRIYNLKQEVHPK